MNNEQFSVTINGVTYNAIWHDKENDRKAEWYIYRNGTKIGTYAGYPSNRNNVENFIRFYLS